MARYFLRHLGKFSFKVDYDKPLSDLVKEYTNGSWYNNSFNKLSADDFGNYDSGKKKIQMFYGIIRYSGKIFPGKGFPTQIAVKVINEADFRPATIVEILHFGILKKELTNEFIIPGFGSLWIEKDGSQKNTPYLGSAESGVLLSNQNTKWSFKCTLVCYIKKRS